MLLALIIIALAVLILVLFLLRSISSDRQHFAALEWYDRKRNFFGLPWSFTVYAMDSERLFLKRGLFNIREDEVRLYRITDVSLKRSFTQRLFGIGTLQCSSSDSMQGDFEIINIKQPEDVKERLSSYVEEQRTKKGVISREFLNSHHRE